MKDEARPLHVKKIIGKKIGNIFRILGNKWTNMLQHMHIDKVLAKSLNG